MKNIDSKTPDLAKLAANASLNAKISEVKKEISSIANLATTASFNDNINEVQSKIPNVTNLATTTALNAVEKKIPTVSILFKKS